MIGAYYAVKRTDSPLWLELFVDGFAQWTNSPLFRARFDTVHMAQAARHKLRQHGYAGIKIVYVRVRPRSERLWMAERLKAWKPVVEAVRDYLGMHKRGVKNSVTGKGLIEAWGWIPKEHLP